ncbi:unnamed protein product [Leptosia nina]|uniref:Uncharacterized protein n=1 Tax=Leptosia nina TaxID=320188 RepID=A0AAV1J2M5_9NEOP
MRGSSAPRLRPAGCTGCRATSGRGRYTAVRPPPRPSLSAVTTTTIISITADSPTDYTYAHQLITAIDIYKYIIDVHTIREKIN